MNAYTLPGVYTTEQDFSQYVPQLSSTILAIVTTASKGPVNERTLISSTEQLIAKFGPISAMHAGLIMASEFLRQGNQCLVVRVAGYDEATGSRILRNAANTQNAITLTAVESGSWSQDLKAVVESGDRAGTYTIRLKYQGVIMETYDNVVMNPSDDANFVETRMALSKFATAAVAPGQTTLKLESGVAFSGGVDGNGVSPSDYVGTVVGGEKTGLQLFRSPREVDVNVLAAPGISDKAVISELLSMAEARQDCLAIPDPPFGLDESEIVDWHNGELGGDDAYPTAALSSNYGALYWGWYQVFNSADNSYVWAPPSAAAAQSFAFTDREWETWFAPAGYRRGALRHAFAVERNPEDGALNYMHGGRAGQFGVNAVNPILEFSGQGIYIWGQRTLQRTPSSLDRVNVRRMMLYMRKVIATAVRYLTFEPNDERMWDEFKGLVTPFVRRVAAGRGIRDYRVIMDETTTSASDMANNVANGRVLIIPTTAAEIINVNFGLLPQGASFDEFLTNNVA